MTLVAKLNDFEGQSHCVWKAVFLACIPTDDEFFIQYQGCCISLDGVNNYKECININKNVFFFGYSVGNNYLCNDFSAKAIKDIFQHSVA